MRRSALENISQTGIIKQYIQTEILKNKYLDVISADQFEKNSEKIQTLDELYKLEKIFNKLNIDSEIKNKYLNTVKQQQDEIVQFMSQNEIDPVKTIQAYTIKKKENQAIQNKILEQQILQ